MRKDLMPNNGVPMFVDPAVDLYGKGAIMMDSFYFNAGFVIDGKPMGLQWHHQTNATPMGPVIMSEFAISDGEERAYSAHGDVVPMGPEAGAAEDRFYVYSKFGVVEGDSKQFTAKLQDGDCGMNLTFTVGPQTLYNGTMGMIRFIGTDSYEFGYPNMDMNGTLTFKGKEYKIENQKAWFDRQWSFEPNGIEAVIPIPGQTLLSWMWMGMILSDDGSESISLWDANGAKGKNRFATIVYPDGTNRNYLMDIEYSDLWVSEKTGNTYPRTTKISVPDADLSFTCTSLIDDPESASAMVSGCQDLVKAVGTYKGQAFERIVGMEIVSDICGDSERVFEMPGMPPM